MQIGRSSTCYRSYKDMVRDEFDASNLRRYRTLTDAEELQADECFPNSPSIDSNKL